MKTKAVFFLSLLLLAARCLPAQESLPAPWKHQDIGAAQTPGTAEHAAGVFTLQGTMDIWGVADGCHIAWQPVHGDLELVARVTAMDNPGGVAHAKASLCIRESLDPGARHVTICVTATDGTQLLYRDKAGGTTTRIFADAEAQKAAVPKGRFPCWLRILRRGNEFIAYESADGEKWQLSGRFTLGLAAESVVGLAASSHKTDTLTKATFDRVKLSKAPAGPEAKSSTKQVSQLTTLGIDGADTPAPDDGPEYSPDGKRIYFNSELNAKVPGHSQCYRMTPAGTGIEQLTRDDRVNWFPHISPDGQWVVYISFPPGTVKHPENKDVILRRMKPDGGEQADIVGFNGGQGTINVNSWSPDSKRFVFVMYPEALGTVERASER